jgi:alcohol dehydrogenase
VVCGTLAATATETNIRALRARSPQSPALGKYAEVGRLLSREPALTDEQAHRRLAEILHEWTQRLALQRLGTYGVQERHVPKIVANARGSSMKTNPLVLTDAEIAEIVRARL